ncbi:MAG: UdgX family uracil-DNA binding protein [Thermoanaerobaculia bacterium]
MARKQETAAPLVPKRPTLPRLRDAAAACQACDLWKRGSQTVFGEGRKGSTVMLIGEQPGDQEDLSGHPFVGPAGRILDKALEEAEIDRRQVYVTNTVKHFKWEPRGRRRIHKKPSSVEITACLPWLEAEIAVVRPAVIVCLGATAAQALLGRQFRVTRDRGKIIDSDLAPYVMATVHPSSLLRAPDDETRRRETEKFIADLRAVRPLIEKRKESRDSRNDRPEREEASRT